MQPQTLPALAALYEQDETAWLEGMARLLAERRLAELDVENLQEYLTSMARRDRREVQRRLIQLIMHRLKWEYQPLKRSKSWRLSIAKQRNELEHLRESGTLRNHAQEFLGKAYTAAVERAAIETGLEPSFFPAASTRTVDDWLDCSVLGV